MLLRTLSDSARFLPARLLLPPYRMINGETAVYGCFSAAHLSLHAHATTLHTHTHTLGGWRMVSVTGGDSLPDKQIYLLYDILSITACFSCATCAMTTTAVSCILRVARHAEMVTSPNRSLANVTSPDFPVLLALLLRFCRSLPAVPYSARV